MTGERILITGGSGFLGSALVKKLLREGWHVRVLDNNSRGHARRLADVIGDIDFINGDVRDYRVVERACKGMNVVAHLAYINGTEFFYSMPEQILEVGIKGAINTIDACLAHKIERYWMLSSSEVYQRAEVVPTDETAALIVPDILNPRYSYGGGKIAAELLAVNYGRKAFRQLAIVRPHNVYGADMGFEHVLPQLIMRAARLDQTTPKGQTVDFPIRGSGEQTRSFVYIDDFTEGCYTAFTQAEKCSFFHIGTMDEIKIKDVVSIVLEVLGRQGNILPSQSPAGETDRRCPDIGRMQALGYAPKIGLKEGIAKMTEWYVAHKSLWPTDA
ncbi:MAG: SDR family NAD(P)-dependent oxidoreductase [Gammaproteobacteria bacterium]|nr:SDR family NAD(P)-dependent oxidoreductase [Gammaproteobacteria bacterium]